MDKQLIPGRGVSISDCVVHQGEKADQHAEPPPSATSVGLDLVETFSCCSHAHAIYTLLPVTLQRKTLRLLMVVALLGLTAGCSGINAGKSVSPLDFLLPGGGG